MTTLLEQSPTPHITWDDISFAEILEEAGEDTNREGIVDTPRRVRKAWKELLSGYHVNTQAILDRQFQDAGSGIQLAKKISFTSVCEHHLLPFFGYMWIGYSARKAVLGLSKLARLVDAYAKRLQIQERLCNSIADDIYEALDPHYVVVICDAQHMCCKGRGVERDLMSFSTIAMRGEVDTQIIALLKE